MYAVAMVLTIEAIPIGALISVLSGCPMRRRSRFWGRIAGVGFGMVLPVLVAALAPLGEETSGTLLLSGLPWGILTLALSRFVLFEGSESDPGSADDGDDGPGPGNDRPMPPGPMGGLPLPDAEPSSRRLRDHRAPGWESRPRRPARQRERLASRRGRLRPGSSPPIV